MKACRRVLVFAILGAGTGLFAGCGGGAATGNNLPGQVSTKGTIADLRGGWLIAGSMPLSNPIGTGNSFFGLALNLDIINGQVTGFGAMQLPCASSSSGAFASGSIGGGIQLGAATVAADGTFTLTDVLLPNSTQHQVVVQGTVPASPGGTWMGTFTVAAPQSNCNGMVPPAQTGSFTAQKIADLNGSFVGHGTLNGTSSPVSFTVSLTQGGAASLNGVTPRVNDQSVLNGTLQVQGISCFKGGTVKTTAGFPEASLTGNLAITEFLMDDGSTVLLNATESDTAATTLTYVSLLVSGGGCDKTFSSLTTAGKQ